jgi:predicted O-linked N-acetylglucosamine transferase (SPINDLY family)
MQKEPETFDGIKFDTLANKPKQVHAQHRFIDPSPVTATNLADLDLEQELLQQYKNAKLLLAEAIYDNSGETPLNQKAQVVNSITTILKQMADIKTQLYNAERLKHLETILVDTLKGFPDMRDAFLVKYKEELHKHELP